MADQREGVLLKFPNANERAQRDIARHVLPYLRREGVGEAQADFITCRLTSLVIKIREDVGDLNFIASQEAGARVSAHIESLTGKFLVELVLTYIELWDAGVR